MKLVIDKETMRLKETQSLKNVHKTPQIFQGRFMCNMKSIMHLYC